MKADLQPFKWELFPLSKCHFNSTSRVKILARPAEGAVQVQPEAEMRRQSWAPLTSLPPTEKTPGRRGGVATSHFRCLTCYPSCALGSVGKEFAYQSVSWGHTFRLLGWYWCSEKVKVAQSRLTLCDPMYYTVHAILRARILEWVAIPFSSGSSQPRDRTQVSWIAGRFFTSWATRKALVSGGMVSN